MIKNISRGLTLVPLINLTWESFLHFTPVKHFFRISIFTLNMQMMYTVLLVLILYAYITISHTPREEWKKKHWDVTLAHKLGVGQTRHRRIPLTKEEGNISLLFPFPPSELCRKKDTTCKIKLELVEAICFLVHCPLSPITAVYMLQTLSRRVKGMNNTMPCRTSGTLVK